MPAAAEVPAAPAPGQQVWDSRWRSDAGSVTAETAVVLPVLLVVLAMAVWVLAAVTAQLRCTDAAALGARAAARGEPTGTVTDVAARAAPPDAAVQARARGDLVEVVVQARVRPFGGVLDVLPPVQVSGRAVAAREDLVGQDPP